MQHPFVYDHAQLELETKQEANAIERDKVKVSYAMVQLAMEQSTIETRKLELMEAKERREQEQYLDETLEKLFYDEDKARAARRLLRTYTPRDAFALILLVLSR